MLIWLTFYLAFIKLYDAACDWQIFRHDDLGGVAAQAGYTRAAFTELKTGGKMRDSIVAFAAANHNAFKSLGTWRTGYNCLYYSGPCTIATSADPGCGAVASWTQGQLYYLCAWSQKHGRSNTLLTLGEEFDNMLGTGIGDETITLFYKCGGDGFKYIAPGSCWTANNVHPTTWVQLNEANNEVDTCAAACKRTYGEECGGFDTRPGCLVYKKITEDDTIVRTKNCDQNGNLIGCDPWAEGECYAIEVPEPQIEHPPDECTWIKDPRYEKGVHPGYVLKGVPATVSGDPHYRTWNGQGHDFQGTRDDEQYYYMHPCKRDIDKNKITRKQMPFTLLGKHESVNPNIVGVRGLDYITFELYDDNHDVYFLWLSANLASFAKESAQHKSTLYDANPEGTTPINPGDNPIGNRFSVNYRLNGRRIDVILTIDGKCEVKLFMYAQGMFRNGRYRMHQLTVYPPECYKCYTCGLFGEFTNNNGKLKTCGGGVIRIARGWYRGSAGFETAFEKRALTWEKSFVEAKCPYWPLGRRRLQEEVVDDTLGDGVLEEPLIDPEIEDQIKDGCEKDSENHQLAVTECHNARANQEECCEALGLDTCNTIEEDCIEDCCNMAPEILPNVNAPEIFEKALEARCAEGLDVVREENDPGNLEVPLDAPVDCETTWVSGPCSASCDGGTLTREGTIVTQAENDGCPCPVELVQEIPCNTQACCYDVSIATFDWDKLTQSGTDKPLVTFPDGGFEVEDLTLNIKVRLPYAGYATAEGELTPRWPITYVLDFEDFDAHLRSINLPGTCENRDPEAFIDKDFSKWWGFSLHPQFNIAEEDHHLSYPPGNLWDLSMPHDDCETIEYSASFTWKDLRECTANGGGESYTKIDNDDPEYLKLLGTFYINVVSPFWPGNDFGVYRVYQLFSQPFVIKVAKTVHVLGSTGINLMTLSVIAVYKSDKIGNEGITTTNDFNLVLMSETSDYMYLEPFNDFFEVELDQESNEGELKPPTAYEQANGNENTNGCLNPKAFICSQLWKIEADNMDCIPDEKSTDFSGIYHLGFNPKCRDGLDTDMQTHCQTFIDDYELAENIELQTTLTWIDKTCNPKVFTTQFSAEMSFHSFDINTNAIDWINPIPSEKLFLAEDEETIGVEIDTGFAEDTFDVFDTELIEVFICTFAPTTVVGKDPYTSLDTLANFGCNGNRDNNDENFYRIYNSDPQIVSTNEFNLANDGTDTNIIRFYFNVPKQIYRDTLYVQAELEVTLLENNGQPRRRILKRVLAKAPKSNKIGHFINSIGINHGQKPKQQPPQEPIINNKPIQQPPQQLPINNYQPWRFDLSSPWIIVIGAVLIIILSLNIVFMCYMNCRSSSRGSCCGSKKGKYAKVRIDETGTEYDSEAQMIQN